MTQTTQQVSFIEHSEIRTQFLHQNTYSYHPERGWAFLQRVCFRILAKLGCNYEEIQITVIKKEQGNKPFMQMAFEQYEGLSNFFNLEPKRFLIGAEEYKQLMSSDVPAREMFSFGVSYNKGQRILGCELVIVPWMKGILVMP